MTKFLLASGNKHKSEELTKHLSSQCIVVEAATKTLDIIEDGSSFSENALKKAKAYYLHYSRPVVSDDSGLVVNCLPDKLGIYSARYGGKGLTDEQRAKKLLEELKDQNDRSAYFHCTLCFYFSENEYFFFEGNLSGLISNEYKGSRGFGYDPVFIPLELEEGNETLAMNPEWKERNSHRAVACRHASFFFSNFLS